MTIHKNDVALRLVRPPSVGQSGVILATIFRHTLTAANGNVTAASDILEIGMLPAMCRPVKATLIGEGFGAITADVGFMTGTPGADANPDGTARTCGDELFDGASVNNATVEAPTKDLLDIVPLETVSRGIGVKLSSNVTANGNQKLTLLLEYIN